MKRGFTLIEMIVAMGMVAILMAPLAASLNAFKATSKVQATLEAPRTAALALDFARNDFQCALAPNGDLAGTFEGTQAYDDRGHEADDVIFFSTADSPQHVSGNGEIKQVELTVASDPKTGDHVLVRRVTRNLLSQIQMTPDEEPLCRGVWSFTAQYFNGSQWSPTWDSTQEDNTAPAAVQVTLVLERPVAGGTTRQFSYVRTFAISCSTAAQDSTVNTGAPPP